MSTQSTERVIIRPAGIEHAALLAERGRETFLCAFDGQIEQSDLVAFADKRYGLEQQHAELADPDTVFFIARAGEEFAGYAKLCSSSPPPDVTSSAAIELERLYLPPKWFGTGVAQALMDACLAEARNQFCDVMWLDVWDGNARAQAFYRKYGFSLVGERPYVVGTSTQLHLLMALALAEK